MSFNRPSIAARVISVAAAAVLAGCATKGDIRDFQAEMHEELRVLAARQDSLIAELRMQTRSTQDTLRTQSDQIVDFRGNVAQQLNEILRRMTTLEAIVGQSQQSLVGMRDQLANLRGSPSGGAPPASGETIPGVVPGAETVAGVGANADQLWNVAREQHTRGSYAAAQRAYQEFLDDHPNDPRAPDAHYYLADILAQQDRPEDAIGAFREIQELYPTAARVPDALYRVAELELDLGNKEEARTTLERIVNTYPDADIARIAAERLEDLN